MITDQESLPNILQTNLVLRPDPVGDHVRDELLVSVDILNRWARGNGKKWSYEIYALKNYLVEHARGWRFRTSVDVTCGTCHGTGVWQAWRRDHSSECRDCDGHGTKRLAFLVSELVCSKAPFEVIQWHTPFERRPLEITRADLLQHVSPGTWKPRQPGIDLDDAAGLALLMQCQAGIREWRAKL